MLSIADVPLIVPSSEWELCRLEEWVRQNIDPTLYRPWLTRAFPGRRLYATSWPTGYEPAGPTRLNTYCHPAWGASRWGYGHFLLSSNQVDTLRRITGGGTGLTPPNQVTLKMDAGLTTPGMTAQVYALCYTPLGRVDPPPPGPAVPGNVPGPIPAPKAFENGLYLVTLVDQRYLWWYESCPEIKVKDSLDWLTLLAQVAGIVPVTITTSASLDISKYLKPSKRFEKLSYEAVPPVLDAIAWNVGLRITPDPATGKVEAQSTASAGTVYVTDDATYPDRTIRAGGDRYMAQL